MRTISQTQLLVIIEYLDAAAAATGSDAGYYLRMARRRLFEAAIQDVTVEPVAANDEAPIREAA